MPNFKANDLVLLASFLEREAKRCAVFETVREAVLRIGSLADAEHQAKLALEGAEADLAWARAEADAARDSVAAAKQAAQQQLAALRLEAEAEMARTQRRHADADRRLDAEIAEKRAELEKMVARIQTVRAAAGVLAHALARP
jgi:hypothetical protein